MDSQIYSLSRRGRGERSFSAFSVIARIKCSGESKGREGEGGLIRSRCQSRFEEGRERRNVGREEGEKMIRGRGAAKKGGMLRTLHTAQGDTS